jgi:hypothetical protein
VLAVIGGTSFFSIITKLNVMPPCRRQGAVLFWGIMKKMLIYQAFSLSVFS